IRSEKGALIGHVATLEDLSESKQSEEALEIEKKDSQARRDELEQRLHNLMNIHQDLKNRLEEQTADFVKANLSLQEQLETRKHAEAELRDNQSRWQAILDHADAIIQLKDAEGRYLLINRA